MDIQGKIREGLARDKYERNTDFRADIPWGDVDEGVREFCYFTADNDLSYLHSKGVVIETITSSLTFAHKEHAYYEPLIEEQEFNGIISDIKIYPSSVKNTVKIVEEKIRDEK